MRRWAAAAAWPLLTTRWRPRSDRGPV